MTDARPGPQFDLATTPWSRRGAYLALSSLTGSVDHPGRLGEREPGLYLFDLSGCRFFGDWNGILRLEGLAADRPVPLTVRSATPARVVLAVATGTIEVAWDGPATLRFRGSGTGLRLTVSVVDPLDSHLGFPMPDGSWRLLMGENPHLAVAAVVGRIAVVAPRVRTGPAPAIPDRTTIDALPGPDGSFEIALTQYVTSHREPATRRPFTECVTHVEDAVAAFTAAFPPVPAGAEDGRDRAAHLAWSSIAGPRGALRRPALLMSKNWMFATWSWDHCFNAVGLAPAHPELAWDQLMAVFDRQADDGAVPDLVHDAGAMYGWVKPPVHGWAVRRLARVGVLTDARTAELYPHLAAWIDWWFRMRDADGDGLPEYHHGNDSGWDNASIFDMGFPAASPDLAAYLVIGLDVLAELAERLGRPVGEAAVWRARADATLAALLDRLWDGGRFRALRVPDGAANQASRSIIPFIPMLLGDRLPAAVRGALVASFRTSGLVTDHGVATEAPGSPLHVEDGYWRGPIWAPTTLLVIDGLRACGEDGLAREIAARFLALCRRSGFAENFAATTGAPLRDPAYTWTASTFLALAGEIA
ncbi:MAG: amylo-alpha-1,6-glucosidase [Chloroflexota bacterium]